MSEFDRKGHWENIYSTKAVDEVSWYQPTPETSLELIEQCNLPTSARIIDIGGGDSFLVDHLIENGYTNVTVLDISEKAIERAQTRLGEQALEVNWVVSDVTKFSSEEKFDIWHDRAAFHFLTSDEDVAKYIEIVKEKVYPGGFMILGTFSENGPKKCSGIDIHQYSEDSLTELFSDDFTKEECFYVDHKTPFDTIQNFVFCRFVRK